MALEVLSSQDRVLYSCSCSQLSTLGELFFCRHCKLPRCQDCVSSTMESFSCPHCFEAAMSDFKSKKGRCSRCFQCPQCFTALSTRSVFVPSEVLGEQSPQKAPNDPVAKPTLKSPGGTKVYHLSCSHCKWSTRDVGIKDQRSPIDFKDRPSPHQTRINTLISFYKDYAVQDNANREKAKKLVTGRRLKTYGNFLDASKFRLKVSESLPSRRTSLTWSDARVREIASVITDEPQPPPEHLYTEAVDLEEVPTLEQRLKDPVYQPENSANLWPCQLRLTGKRLHRCKGCDHILMKAEMNLSSVRFKIQQTALHTFPRVRIATFPSLSAGTSNEVVLSVTNPFNYGVTVSFTECSPEQLKPIKESLSPVETPKGKFYLTPNDDVVDLLEDEAESGVSDDPMYVFNRLPGKLFLKFKVTPELATEKVHFIFAMKFDYKPMVEAGEDEMAVVNVPVLVRLGKPS